MGSKGTNFTLSETEQALLSDVTFFKSKIALTTHISQIFGDLEIKLHEKATLYSDRIPAAALQKRGKISRGENYLGLPYLVLDHPAVFGKDGVFAFRTMMWWGHPFSCTFHISGKYLTKLHPGFSGFAGSLINQNVFACINENQWIHHQEQSNYIPFKDFTKLHGDWNFFAESKGFLKAAIQIPITKSDELETGVINFLEGILNQIKE